MNVSSDKRTRSHRLKRAMNDGDQQTIWKKVAIQEGNILQYVCLYNMSK
jgi:hypothetical protein